MIAHQRQTDAPAVVPLARDRLADAARLLDRACAYERAGAVAEEKLFEPGPRDQARPLAVLDRARLRGVAVVSGRWLRLLAVDPDERGRGVGSALLAAAEAAMAGHDRVHVMDQPGNYLAPGIDLRDRATLDWLVRRGYAVRGENVNLVIDVTARNPRVGEARAAALAAALPGYELRRGRPGDRPAIDALVERGGFAGAWRHEVGRALLAETPGVQLALHGGEVVAFAAHDGNNRGLGWFGPAGTAPEHRGRGLGQALLVACLVDVARAGHEACEVAWIGPREFYQGAVGVAGERRFAVLRKELAR